MFFWRTAGLFALVLLVQEALIVVFLGASQINYILLTFLAVSAAMIHQDYGSFLLYGCEGCSNMYC
jgi:hypothetical protein